MRTKKLKPLAYGCVCGPGALYRSHRRVGIVYRRRDQCCLEMWSASEVQSGL